MDLSVITLDDPLIVRPYGPRKFKAPLGVCAFHWDTWRGNTLTGPNPQLVTMELCQFTSVEDLARIFYWERAERERQE